MAEGGGGEKPYVSDASKPIEVSGGSKGAGGVTDWFEQRLYLAPYSSGKAIIIETGIGFGLTSASDKVTLKFMISRDLN
jgi:hypothetical protein